MDVPKKSLGQHWLHDDETLEAMVTAADVRAEDIVLEIGPGLGTLTAKLTAAAARVVAVEFDDALAAALPGRVSASNLEVARQDILQFNLTQLPPRYKVAANIPYYLTSNLLRVLCESTNPFSAAALLVQKEVAQRVAAGPGGMSLLALGVQLYCDVSLGQVVPAELFTPPPKVDSQILILHHLGRPRFDDVSPKEFFRIARAGFGQRRKTLQNALQGGLHCSREQAQAYLTAAGIAPTARAQTLSLEDWRRLTLVCS